MEAKRPRNRYKPLLWAAVGADTWVSLPYSDRAWRSLQELRRRYGLSRKVLLLARRDETPPVILIGGREGIKG